ncbi:MAG: hypothetical protein PHF67_01425 [Candidatus Nanoarchaeia archaeon]|nr:hypothetical protein [Candidatus Nanoarchaeia archaeon]
MKKSLLNLIGIGVLGLSTFGCADRCRTMPSQLPVLQAPAICVPAQNDPTKLPAEPKEDTQAKKENNADNWKLGAYSSERFGDMVLSSGYHVGKFPALTNDTGATIENGRFSMTGWRWSVYSEGHNVEEDYGISTTTKLTDNLSLLVDMQDWGYAGIHNSVGVVGAAFNQNDFGVKFQTFHSFDDNGQLYCGTVSRKVGEKVTLDLSTAYSDDFLCVGKKGFQHVTPGVKVKLGSLGPVDFSGDIEYQFGLNGQRDSFLYGAVTASIATPKVDLKKGE